MAFTLNKILGTDTVGQAFVKTNQNIDKQIVSGNTDGQNLRFVSKDGTLESVNLSSVTLNFLPLTGGLMDGPLRIKDDSTGNDIRIDGNSIKIFNDANNKTLTLSAVPTNNQTILFPDGEGTLALLSDIGSGSFLALTGGTVTGPTTFIDFATPNNDFIQISGGSITFNNLDEQGSTKIINQVSGQSNTVILPRINGNLALISDITAATTNKFVPLTGTSLGSEITGDIIITNSNNLRVQDGSDVNSLELNINSIDFRDDYNSVKTRLQLTPFVNSDATINMIDTLPDGYMVIVPTPSGEGGKPIIVNAGGDGWEYATGGYVINTGDNITGTYNISDIGTGAAIIMSANTPSIELNGDTTASLRVFETAQFRSTTISPNEINFNREVLGQNRTLRIQPDLNTTGNSIVTLLKPIGDGSSIIATVGAIAYKANQFIKVNNDGDGFDFGTISGAGTVSVITSATGFTISGASTSGPSGGGVTGVTSAGTGNRLLISSITNNNIVQKSLSGGTNVTITDSNGTLTFSSAGGTGTVTGATGAGGGIDIYQSATTSTLTFRSISGSNGFEATSVGSLAIVRPVAAARTANRMLVTDGSGNMTTNANIQIEQTIGGIGIGGVGGVATARLQIQAQSASIAPLRFNKTATDYTGAIDGSLWYLTSGNSLKFYKSNIATDFIFKDNNNTLTGTSNNRVIQADSNGTISASANIISFGLFNMITSVTITNTTSETSIIATGGTQLVGSNILNASSNPTSPQLVAGKKFRFTANGTIATHSSAGNLTARLKLGNTVIASVSGFTLHDSISSPNNFFIESSFTIRTQGASGTVVGCGNLETDHQLLRANPQGNSFVGLNNLGSLTIDTTTDKAFDFTFQFGTASANNIITINEATLEYLN